MDDLLNIIKEINLPNAYHHFNENESPKPPFIIYLIPGANNFSADGIPYKKINEVNIEIYTDYKDIKLEEKVEAVIENHGFFYTKNEVWIESEKLYEVLYTFDMEVKENGK